jgi:hypothetical protein
MRLKILQCNVEDNTFHCPSYRLILKPKYYLSGAREGFYLRTKVTIFPKKGSGFLISLLLSNQKITIDPTDLPINPHTSRDGTFREGKTRFSNALSHKPVPIF